MVNADQCPFVVFRCGTKVSNVKTHRPWQHDVSIIALSEPYSYHRPVVERPPVRMELREMSMNKDLWTLFMLGLESFKTQNEKDPLSWFQIAGKERVTPQDFSLVH
jgi:hypothetical protein